MTREEELAKIEEFVASGRMKLIPLGMSSNLEDNTLVKRMAAARARANQKSRTRAKARKKSNA